MNSRRIRTKLLIIVFSLTGVVQAQQDMLLSQYMFNHLLINPAYAGSHEYMMSSLLYRKQWVGYEGAPVSQVASLHGPIGLTDFGAGMMISHDVIGVTERTDAFANAAYHLRLGERTKLAMGLRAGGGYYSCRNSDLKVWDNSDQVFKENVASRFLPNAGAGLYLHAPKSYFGVSVPSLISYDPQDRFGISLSGSDFVPRQVRHYFMTAGTVLTINADIVMKPSVLVKYVKNAPVQADFNLNFLFLKTLWLGGSYRTDDAVVGIMELQLSRRLRIGYSYDYTLSEIQYYSAGSHEFMIGYDFGTEVSKVATPRYF
ncbi:MAG: hypothetical protein RL213_2017 [Bacteroidota bacterium]|jgi:type IX secretion system PorP/SprF family membrane protein